MAFMKTTNKKAIMILCSCGCGEEVTKEGNRYIRGHQRIGEKHSEESKRKISKTLTGKKLSEKTKRKIGLGNRGKNKGKVFTEEHKRKISKSNITHGKVSILNKHRQYKKEECFFNCENTIKYNIRHEPPIKDNILIWEGRLVNLCTNCHKRVHDKTLKLPHNVGIKWILKETEKVLRGE